MTTPLAAAARTFAALLETAGPDALAARLEPDGAERPARPRRRADMTDEALDAYWDAIGAPAEVKAALVDEETRAHMSAYARNIENFIGEARVPIGLAGPLRVNGAVRRADYLLPLATTEAALVASYARGAELLTACGGCAAAVVAKGVTRTPGFIFSDLTSAGRFVHWAAANADAIKAAAEATTRHGELVDIGVNLEGANVYLTFKFETADASGQNMVTIATDAACRHIIENSPVQPRRWFVEANLSGDKKATAQSFQSVRGRKAIAEARLPRVQVERRLHASLEAIVDYWRMSALGGVMSGQIGAQGHIANGLAALFIATGQDAATVSECAVGVTRLEIDAEHDALYASLTLPNLIVGTVGGGAGLPTPKACLQLMGLEGAGDADAFAEACAALCLGGELSIIGALAAGHFTRAHASLARGTETP